MLVGVGKGTAVSVAGLDGVAGRLVGKLHAKMESDKGIRVYNQENRGVCLIFILNACLRSIEQMSMNIA